MAMADKAAIEMKEGIEGAAKEGEGGEGEDPGSEGVLADGQEGVQEPVNPRALVEPVYGAGRNR